MEAGQAGARVLYRVNGSISSWRVELALHEKGLPFEARRLRVMSEPRETRSPAFLAINPRGKAPALVEPDGTILVESLAILPWLEWRYPAPPLLSDDPALRARQGCYVQEAETAACHYEPIENLFLRSPAEMSEAERGGIRAALGMVRWELDLWERRLRENNPGADLSGAGFIAGPDLSLADCSLYPLLAYMQRRGLDLGPWPGLAAYEARFRARASAQASRPAGWAPGRVGRADLFRLAAGV